MRFYAAVTGTLAALSLAALVTAAGVSLAVALPAGRRRLAGALAGFERHPLAWACAVALLATSASLYLSELVGLVPCQLCWYQRIAMYPLIVVLGVATLRADAGAWRYALPLAVVGLATAAYHVSLQLRPGATSAACDAGVPCSARYLAVFGFVSIPVMALGAFSLIAALCLVVRLLERAREGEAAGPGRVGPPRAA